MLITFYCNAKLRKVTIAYICSMKTVNRYVGIVEARRLTGITEWTLRKMCRNGYIECKKVGIKRWLVKIGEGDEICYK